MTQYFLPYRSFERNINVKADLSNYATRADLKDATGTDTSNFSLKPNLGSLKREVDELDIEKLVPAPVDLSKLSDVVKMMLSKKTMYDKLVAKVNNINTKEFVLKTKYNTGKSDLEKKISDAENKILMLVDLFQKLNMIQTNPI